VNKDGTWHEVAVKILHPNVEADIDADLDLMRLAVRHLDWLPFTVFSVWLNLGAVVEEFAELLKRQLDLRTEAKNLDRFNENFKDDKNIVFPKTVDGFEATENLLIETYCKGTPVVEYAKAHKDDPKLLRGLCETAIYAVCKMIFIDNFMHADLHP
jgi:aarF domain-containing kinase